jgi:hypothetical protein
MISFREIPDDIILKIVSLTDPHVRINIMKTCKYLYELLKNNDMFKLSSSVYHMATLEKTLIIEKKYTQDLIFKRKLLAILGTFKLKSYNEKFDKVIFDKILQFDINIYNLFDIDYDSVYFDTNFNNLNRKFNMGGV